MIIVNRPAFSACRTARAYRDGSERDGAGALHQAGNRTWRKNLVAPAGGFDEAYEYDGLYQLTDMRCGNLNINQTTIGGVPVWEETWDDDSAGNWKTYTTRVGGADPLEQSREHNKVNEITLIDESAATVGYDLAGNMTVMPKVSDLVTSQQNTFDAWNRLVQVAEGATVIGSYAYDGLTRRIWKESVEGATLARRHGYFTSQWQLIEERLDAATTAERQFVWGTRYVDDLILRDFEGFTPSRLYATHDQWHVISLLDAAGTVEERYAYTAFGMPTVLTGAFGDRSESFYGWETRYGAYRYDVETGLCCVRYRYFHPALGRWLSRDPIEEITGTNVIRIRYDVYGVPAFTAGINRYMLRFGVESDDAGIGGLLDANPPSNSVDTNLYRYVENNPLGQADPFGLGSDLEKVGKAISDFIKGVGKGTSPEVAAACKNFTACCCVVEFGTGPDCCATICNAIAEQGGVFVQLNCYAKCAEIYDKNCNQKKK